MYIGSQTRLSDVMPKLRNSPERDTIDPLSQVDVYRVRSHGIRAIKGREGVKLLRNAIRSAHFALLANPADPETPVHYLEIALHIIDKIDDKNFVRRVALPRACQWAMHVFEDVEGYQYGIQALQIEEMFRNKTRQIYGVSQDFESFRDIVGFVGNAVLKNHVFSRGIGIPNIGERDGGAIPGTIREAFRNLRDLDPVKRSEGFQRIHGSLGLDGLRMVQGHIAGYHGFAQSRLQLEKSHLAALLDATTPEGRSAAAQLTFATESEDRIHGYRELANHEGAETFKILEWSIASPSAPRLPDNELLAICAAAQECREGHLKFNEYSDFARNIENHAVGSDQLMRERCIRACIYLDIDSKRVTDSMRNFLTSEKRPAPILKLRAAQYLAVQGNNFAWGEDYSTDAQLVIDVLVDLSGRQRDVPPALAEDLIESLDRSRLRSQMVPFIIRNLNTGSHNIRLNLLRALEKAQPSTDLLVELLQVREGLITRDCRARKEYSKRENSHFPWMRNDAKRWQDQLLRIQERQAILDRIILKSIEADPRALDRMLKERAESHQLLVQLFPFIEHFKRSDLASELTVIESAWSSKEKKGKAPSPELVALRQLIAKLKVAH